jgi:murein DD-endopeptidase MepM/ murein hydrolase activator NlpD
VALAVVNAFVFLGGDGPRLGLGGLPDAMISDGDEVLSGHAEAPETACTARPVQVFAGLEQLLPFSTDLGRGQTLRLALLDVGIASDQIDALELAIRSHVDLGLLAGSGAPVRVATDRKGIVHAIEIELAEGHLVQACRAERGFQVRNLQHPLRTDVVVIGVELDRHADLAGALAEAGETADLMRLVAESLAHDIDLRVEARPGDRLQVMVEKRWVGRHFHRYGALLAIRYIGAAARVAYYRYAPEGRAAELYDREGRSVRRQLLRSPLSWHPVGPDTRPILEPKVEVIEGRQGAAYRVPEGAPVVSLLDGVVSTRIEGGKLGRVLEIRGEDGTVVRYGHLGRIIGDLEPGSVVHQGQLVALAGHTGNTPTDRLRLELWQATASGEKSLDPMMLTAKAGARPKVTGEPIPQASLERYRKDIAGWHRALRQAE